MADISLDSHFNDCLASVEYRGTESNDRIPLFPSMYGGNTSTAPCPTPWTLYQAFSSPMNTFGSPHLDYEARFPIDSPASLHALSACSSQNSGLCEREPYWDPSTPGTTHNTMSPSPTISSFYLTDTYASPYPLPALGASMDLSYGGDRCDSGYRICKEADLVGSSAELAVPAVTDVHDNSYLASSIGTQSRMGYGSAIDREHASENVTSAKEGTKTLSSNDHESHSGSNRKNQHPQSGKRPPKLPKRSSGRIEKPSGRTKPPTSAGKTKGKRCAKCDVSFKDKQELEQHFAEHARPYFCVFHYAGCESDFRTKNEWKRHTYSQHLCLEYYHCRHAECSAAKPPSGQHRCKTLPQFGGVFNRKDLFTQHLRRMHQPNSSNAKACKKWEDQIKHMQQTAHRKRCDLPQFMTCPAGNCKERFVGQRAWDDRMEHVARHLERAAEGLEPRLAFGGDGDATLTKWAESPEVNVVRRFKGGWRLNNPIRPKDDDDDDDEGLSSNGVPDESDEDAEGEVCWNMGFPGAIVY